jgi:hypothetical protein
MENKKNGTGWITPTNLTSLGVWKVVSLKLHEQLGMEAIYKGQKSVCKRPHLLF